MRWMAPLAFAVVLFVLTLRTAFIEPLIVIGVAALALVVVGLLLPWRWPFVAATCLFLTGHALALWGMDAPVDVPGGLGFGLALLFLLHAAHAGRAMRGASVGARVLREQIVGGVRFAVVALLAAMLGMGLAAPLSGVLPAALAPLLAAASALGVVAAVALAATRAGRRGDTSRHA